MTKEQSPLIQIFLRHYDTTDRLREGMDVGSIPYPSGIDPFSNLINTLENDIRRFNPEIKKKLDLAKEKFLVICEEKKQEIEQDYKENLEQDEFGEDAKKKSLINQDYIFYRDYFNLMTDLLYDGGYL